LYDRNRTPRPEGRDAAERATTFAQLGLHQDLLDNIDGLGFARPTPVQARAIPLAIQGRDVLASAMTGSGKTAAFLLPVLQRLLTEGRASSTSAGTMARRERTGTRALILTPTRELAAQIVEHLRELSKGTGIRGAAIYGGVAMEPQRRAFQQGTAILVATPGRLLDHFQYPYARLPDLDHLVLDEADRMLDMGFLPDIRRVLRHLPDGPRQTFFFSATMPQPIVKLAHEMLRNPATVRVQAKQAPAKGIVQALYPVPGERKVALLAELIARGEIGNVIAFCRTKHRTNRLAQRLEREGISVARIHGNRSQSQRTQALAGFKSGRYQVLAATDIVARGIDVEALDHVVNFDVPAAPADYIHRVGRTARAEATGEAYTFVSPQEQGDVRAIERALGASIQRRTLEGFDYGAGSDERFEVPAGERIAALRARRSEERARTRAKADQKANGGRANGRAPGRGRSEARSTDGRGRPEARSIEGRGRGSSADRPQANKPARYRGLRGSAGARG
jgi:ATP-dependent RNA helicase RhlE